MPGPAGEGHELDQAAGPIDEQVSGDSQMLDLSEVGMQTGVEAILEEGCDVRPSELTGRQADAVYDDQVDRRSFGPGVVIGGGDLSRVEESALLGVHPHWIG